MPGMCQKRAGNWYVPGDGWFVPESAGMRLGGVRL